jgi:hypothetical protein
MLYKHIDGVFVKAQFAEENGLRYRYRLEVTLENAPRNGKTVCVIMQNPSYASETIADKSVQFMEKVIFRKELPEFGKVCRLIVVNQFARIQTNGFKGLAHEVGFYNDLAIEAAFKESDIIIVAWGCSNPFTERKGFALNLLKAMKGKRKYVTRMHPSRGRYAGFIQLLDV